jgi:hypothetical protein
VVNVVFLGQVCVRVQALYVDISTLWTFLDGPFDRAEENV